MEVDHAQLAFQILEMSLAKSFGENIDRLVLRLHMPKNKEARHEFFVYKMTVNLDVLGPLMEDGILGNM